MTEPSGQGASPPGPLALFLAFGKIGILGFGGVAAWVRQVVVTERRWLDDRAFSELLGVSNVLPGANTVNLAAILGDRSCGLPGAIAALAGLVGLPVLALVGIALGYDRLAGSPSFQAALAGASAAAAGLVLGNGLKLMRALATDRLSIVVALVVLAIVAVGRFPLVPVLVLAIPVSLLAFLLRARRQGT